MLPVDIISLVVSQISSTKALLNFRLACTTTHNEIPIAHVAGMPLETLQRLIAARHRVIMGSPRGMPQNCGNIGASFNESGTALWTWSNINSGRVCIERYALHQDGDWRHSVSYEATTYNSTYLWLHVAEGGIVCTLSTMDEDLPVIFSAFSPDDALGINLHTEIDRQLLLNADATFDSTTVMFASWKGQAYLLVIPTTETFSMGLLRIKKDGPWIWWDVQINYPNNTRPMRVRAACQVDSRILALPDRGGMLFGIDLNDNSPIPSMAARMRILSVDISSMCAIMHENRHRVLAYSKTGRVLTHLVEPNTARPIAPWLGPIGAYLFITPHSAALFLERTNTYAICSLHTGDVVRRLALDHTPSPFVTLRAGELWSVDTSMRVHKQFNDAAASTHAASK